MTTNERTTMTMLNKHVVVTTSHRGVFGGVLIHQEGRHAQGRADVRVLVSGRASGRWARSDRADEDLSGDASRPRDGADRCHFDRRDDARGRDRVDGASVGMSGYGDGYSSGSGSGYGYGSGYSSGYGEALRTHLAAAYGDRVPGSVIAIWRSDARGLPANGGHGTAPAIGEWQEVRGPLKLCSGHALHATFTPSQWEGDRWWVVALAEPVAEDGDNIGSLRRMVIEELV